MKRVVKTTWAVLMAAVTAITACQKEEDVSDSEHVEFTIESCDILEESDPETRTAFTTPQKNIFPTLWTGGENVGVFYQARSGGFGALTAVAKASKDRTTATLSALDIPSSLRTVFFLMICPAGAVTSATSSTSIRVSVPESQKPSTTSPDEAAMLLGARTATSSTVPASVSFSPVHLTSYMRLSLKNTGSIGLIQSATVTAEVPIAGSATFDTASPTSISAVAGSNAKSVTATTRYNNNIWFACLPATIEGTTLTIKATGSSGSLTRQITVPAGKNLEAGKIAILSVDMNPTVAVTGVTLNNTTLSLGVGQTSTLTATVTPSNASDKTVTWTSSNTAVATVSSGGVVRGVSAGSATITARTSDGGYTATCAVTVHKTPTRVVIDKESDFRFDLDDRVYHISVGSTATITYTVYYSDGTSEESRNGTATLVSGSGVTVSSPSYVSMTCTQAGKDARIRVASKYDASVYDEMLVQTWDQATSIELNWSGTFGNWIKTGAYAEVNAVVKPATARQKIVVRNSSGNNWDVLQQKDLRLQLRAPNIEDKASNYEQFRASDLTLSIANATGDLLVTKTFSLTNLDLKNSKPLDYICYSSSEGQFKILDGGLRLYWANNNPTRAVYAESPTLSVPSGYSVVGIVTENYAQGWVYRTPPGVYNASAYPVVEKVDGTLMSSAQFHGYAIALHDASDGCKWSTDHDNVIANENWLSEIGLCTVLDSQLHNALGLTIAAYYYNWCRGGSHDIVPVFAVQDYWARYPLQSYHFVINSIDWAIQDFNSWVVPTHDSFWPLESASGLSDSVMLTLFNNRILAAGGTRIYADDLGYWTIQQDGANLAHIVWAGGRATRNKSSSARVRPFLVF